MVPRDDAIAAVQAISVERRVAGGFGSSEPSRQGEAPAADAGGAGRGAAGGEGLKLQLQAQDARLTFETDRDSGKLVVRLKDSSGRVIRQIPPDEMLRLARAIDQYLGLLVDRQS